MAKGDKLKASLHAPAARRSEPLCWSVIRLPRLVSVPVPPRLTPPQLLNWYSPVVVLIWRMLPLLSS